MTMIITDYPHAFINMHGWLKPEIFVLRSKNINFVGLGVFMGKDIYEHVITPACYVNLKKEVCEIRCDWTLILF